MTLRFIGGFDYEKRMKDLIDKNLRAEKMRAMRRSGATLQEIGDKHGLTKARVLQIIGKMVEE